jgi:hypothetical protein
MGPLPFTTTVLKWEKQDFLGSTVEARQLILQLFHPATVCELSKTIRALLVVEFPTAIPL